MSRVEDDRQAAEGRGAAGPGEAPPRGQGQAVPGGDRLLQAGAAAEGRSRPLRPQDAPAVPGQVRPRPHAAGGQVRRHARHGAPAGRARGVVEPSRSRARIQKSTLDARRVAPGGRQDDRRDAGLAHRGVRQEQRQLGPRRGGGPEQGRAQDGRGRRWQGQRGRQGQEGRARLLGGLSLQPRASRPPCPWPSPSPPRARSVCAPSPPRSPRRSSSACAWAPMPRGPPSSRSICAATCSAACPSRSARRTGRSAPSSVASDRDVLKMLEEQRKGLKSALAGRGLTLEDLKVEAKS